MGTDNVLFTIEILLFQTAALVHIMLMRERPILAPISLVSSVILAIAGSTLWAAGLAVQALPFFVPLMVFLAAYAVYGLYEHWGL